MNEDTATTLKDRGEKYGVFASHAHISQTLKDILGVTSGWRRLSFSQKEALELIMHKIARILNGDPNYDDSWRDIAGYSQLIVNELNADAKMEALNDMHKL